MSGMVGVRCSDSISYAVPEVNLLGEFPAGTEKHLPGIGAVFEKHIRAALNFSAAAVLWDAYVWIVVPLQRCSAQLTQPSSGVAAMAARIRRIFSNP